MLEAPKINLLFQDAFESPAEAAPLFLTCQEITGHLKIAATSARRAVVKFTFSGHLMNCIGFPSNGRITPPNLSLKRDIYECSMVQDLQPSNNGCSVSFRFPFDRRFLRTDDSSEDEEDLFPPSLEENSLRPGSRGGYSKVTYSVRATVYMDGTKPFSTKREVRVIDETVPQGPPVWTEGFGNEYMCQQRRTMKNKFGLPQGRLYLSVIEPTPIEIRPGKERMMAEIPMNLLYEAMPVNGTILKTWTASLTWTLKASTFVSTVAMRSLPTVEQAKKSPFLRVAESTISSGSQKIGLTFQRLSTSNNPNALNWSAQSILRLDVTPDLLPPPSFSSSFLTRRYLICIQIMPSGEGTSVFNLNVPIQFTYSGGRTTTFQPRERGSIERGSIDTVLPQYVR